MSIEKDTITAIFQRHEVDPLHREDPELIGAAYALAFITHAEEGPEARLYASDVTLFDDDSEDGPHSYQASTAAMLTEIYDARIRHRSHELQDADFDAMAGDSRG